MKKILLIDDDKDIAELIKIILGDKYNVESKDNPQNIAAKIVSFAPDLVLLDNTVGQKQAVEIIGDLRAADGYNTVPVVLFSAHDNIEHIATEIQADAFLSKPFNLTELYTCIDRLIA